jgi:hypothetical protein
VTLPRRWHKLPRHGGSPSHGPSPSPPPSNEPDLALVRPLGPGPWYNLPASGTWLGPMAPAERRRRPRGANSQAACDGKWARDLPPRAGRGGGRPGVMRPVLSRLLRLRPVQAGAGTPNLPGAFKLQVGCSIIGWRRQTIAGTLITREQKGSSGSEVRRLAPSPVVYERRLQAKKEPASPNKNVRGRERERKGEGRGGEGRGGEGRERASAHLYRCLPSDACIRYRLTVH